MPAQGRHRGPVPQPLCAQHRVQPFAERRRDPYYGRNSPVSPWSTERPRLVGGIPPQLEHAHTQKSPAAERGAACRDARRHTYGTPTGLDPTAMDLNSSSWLTALHSPGAERDAALVRLHEMLLRAATRETRRREPAARIGGPELDDLAHQAANDALVALLAKLDTFRGESLFTTWAYRFVVLEVSSKLGRHFWRRPSMSVDADDWERLPARVALDPLAQAQQRELITAVRRAVDETLTDHQRRLFVAIVVDGVPLEAMVSCSGSSRGAIYKAVFDARRKIRTFLAAHGYLEGGGTATRPPDRQAQAGRP